jgi:hypothetical protein
MLMMTNADLRGSRVDDGVVSSKIGQPLRRPLPRSTRRRLLPSTTTLIEPGAKDVLLPREGLYPWHFIEWRRVCDAGEVAGFEDKPDRPARNPAEAQVVTAHRNPSHGNETTPACRLLGKPTTTLHRHRRPELAGPRPPRPAPTIKRTEAQRASVLAPLNNPLRTSTNDRLHAQECRHGSQPWSTDGDKFRRG